MAQARGANFRITSWQYLDDLPGLEFSYLCDVYGAFHEYIVFPVISDFSSRQDEDLAQVIQLLHAALGVSYFKCAAAAHLSFDSGPQTPAARSLTEAFYGPGLGEFFVRSGLGYPCPVTIDWGQARGADANSSELKRTGEQSSLPDALVGFGGGKDSYVAMDVVRRAAKDAQFFRVRSHLDRPRLEPVPDDGMLYLDRFLDPKLRDVNAQGAFNGHVPVTAMNSLIALVAAKALGAGNVIFANERSADEGTAMVNGHEINHQYSKSLDLELLLARALSEIGTDLPAYFSVLRPVSEVWIARRLAQLPDLHQQFMSCNKNFRIGNTGKMRWCGECPKCAFTFLLFSPFLPKVRLLEIFGKNLLEEKSLIPIFEELVGLKPVKPWECVGTVEECRTILALISEHADWKDAHVVAAIAPRLAAGDPEFDAKQTFDNLLQINGLHHVPDRYLSALQRADVQSQETGVAPV